MYTRWGRTNCTDGIHTELVYHGFVGGSSFLSTGGASDYLCLPSDPQWGSYNEVANGLGEVWGAEYETASFPFTLRNEGPSTLQNQNVPCAVCRAKTRASVLMVPARQECHEGWTREYSGYLTSGHKAHKGRYQYTCMDAAPGSDVAGYRDENGALFYSVDGVCGSLPCPPYINGRELTCVVCTK
ncbi:hypothetical protein CAPTEDRAFT_175203 [Capitella teleta]|uniref:Short-chain collagen C4-like n=1 Tax=Capitella teleta TaxID=283909 RepID=R7UB02_CAPTE|nr:hypothetical protein CAPTEDRAFT_175203 [Capitella teleta]|eukprot:ELU03540.1 hypothetical protein CAPTEDRAFT_175203 [Capitella teleta]